MPAKLSQIEFIRKASQIHKGVYDYSATEYKTSNIQIEIICKEHGSFFQIPSNHLKGCGCSKCGVEARASKLTLNTDKFIEKALTVHQNKYDYSLVKYEGFDTMLDIVCPVHGKFQQRANNHLAGCGCSLCGKERQTSAQQDDKQRFINKALKVHSGYDYTRLEYKGSRVPIEILCKEHGGFWQNPADHIQGKGCPQCGVAKRNKAITWDKGEFIQAAQAIHGDEYDYSQTVYFRFHKPLFITCKQHGEFKQSPAHHLRGQGCPKCGLVKVSLNQRMNLEEFIAKAIKLHGTTYDYSKAIYSTSRGKVEIVCPKHGSFWQNSDDHLGGHGCPSCVHLYSEPHKEIEKYLLELGVLFESNTRKVITPYELDIWVPSHNFAIEFNGRYYHSLDGTEPPQAKYRHRDEFNLCQKQGILLLQIDEHEWNAPVTKEVWKSLIASKLGKHTKVYARNTTFQPISSTEAQDFLATNHLQGAPAAIRWSFGLFYKDELVGVVCYCYHEHTKINLSRLAFKLNTTVVGGSQKLFKNSLPVLPNLEIVSFSSNRYSDGSIYLTLGFEKTEDLPPSYQWYFKGRIWNKRSLRRKSLEKIIPDFNPVETEHWNLYHNGARCLYDAGYQKWVYQKGKT